VVLGKTDIKLIRLKTTRLVEAEKRCVKTSMKTNKLKRHLETVQAECVGKRNMNFSV